MRYRTVYMLQNAYMRAPANHSKILYLESLRGIAAVGVALHHSRLDTPLASNTFTDNAWLLVDFFFVLSGFVIALNYQGAIRDTNTLVAFQYKRFLRLYPLHLVMLLVFVALECAKYLATVMGGLSADAEAFAGNNLFTFLASLTLTQSLFINGSIWNGPSWSISAEFYTYALFGLVVLLCRGKRAGIVAASTVLSLAGGIYVWRAGFDVLIPRCLLSFFIGVLAFNLVAVSQSRKTGWAGTAVVGAVVLLLSYRIWEPHVPATMIFPPLFGLLIYSLVVWEGGGALKRALESRALVYLGTISYGIYMVHYAVWWVINQLLRFVFKVETFTTASGNTILHLTDPWLATLVALLGMGITLALAHASYRYFEKPLMDWGWQRRAGVRRGSVGITH